MSPLSLIREGPAEDLKMNNTFSNTSMKCVRDTSVTAVVFPCLYSILFIVALILNSLAAWIFFNIPSTSTFVVFLKNVVSPLLHKCHCHYKYTHTHTHTKKSILWILPYQVVADLLMTLTIPLRVLSDAGVGSWRLRAFHCRYSAVLFYITMYISILLLGLISLDRYLKIVKPFGKCILQRVRVGQLLSAAVWVVMLCLALPNVILSDQTPHVSGGKLKCSSMKSKAGLLWHEGFNYFCQVVFWGTLALMVVCYTFISKKVYESYKASKSRSQAASRRTKAKVFVVVGVFFICFAPFHFARVPYTLTQTRSIASHCQAQNALYIAKETTLWLSTTNVCLDPLIYVFLCKVFRKKLTAALCWKPLYKGTTESATATSTQLEMSQINHSNRLSYNGMLQHSEQYTMEHN
uniref:Purinergic receptor P2Y13 n=1 Tax=Acanthochromis polyacanthus TaxID=80966 RepID=A0A3Q1GAR4_9TELE